MRSKILVRVICRKMLGLLFWGLSYFFKNDKRYFVFGSDGGVRTSNSYYLFLRMQSLGYDCYWAYNELETVRGIIGQDSLIKKGSLDYFIVCFRAKVFFITHTISDVFIIKPHGTFVVNLWHGIPIKKMAFDSNIFISRYKMKKRLGLRTEFPLWDYFCCSSSFYAEVLSNAFHLQKHKFIICGSAKNFGSDCVDDTAHSNNIFDAASVVLYAPTYRPWQSNYLDFLYCRKLHSFLENNDITILVKLHPYEYNSVVLEELGDNIKLSEKYFPELPIEDLYVVSDVLITDVSSAIFDFSLVNNKFLVFATDFDDYDERIGGAYVDVKNDFSSIFMNDLDCLMDGLFDLCVSKKSYNVDLKKYMNPCTENESINILIERLSRDGVL